MQWASRIVIRSKDSSKQAKSDIIAEIISKSSYSIRHAKVRKINTIYSVKLETNIFYKILGLE